MATSQASSKLRLRVRVSDGKDYTRYTYIHVPSSITDVDSLITYLLRTEPKTTEVTQGWLELQTTLLRNGEPGERFCHLASLPEDTPIWKLTPDEKLTLYSTVASISRVKVVLPDNRSLAAEPTERRNGKGLNSSQASPEDNNLHQPPGQLEPERPVLAICLGSTSRPAGDNVCSATEAQAEVVPGQANSETGPSPETSPGEFVQTMVQTEDNAPTHGVLSISVPQFPTSLSTPSSFSPPPASCPNINNLPPPPLLLSPENRPGKVFFPSLPVIRPRVLPLSSPSYFPDKRPVSPVDSSKRGGPGLAKRCKLCRQYKKGSHGRNGSECPICPTCGSNKRDPKWKDFHPPGGSCNVGSLTQHESSIPSAT